MEKMTVKKLLGFLGACILLVSACAINSPANVTIKVAYSGLPLAPASAPSRLLLPTSSYLELKVLSGPATVVQTLSASLASTSAAFKLVLNPGTYTFVLTAYVNAANLNPLFIGQGDFVIASGDNTAQIYLKPYEDPQKPLGSLEWTSNLVLNPGQAQSLTYQFTNTKNGLTVSGLTGGFAYYFQDSAGHPLVTTGGSLAPGLTADGKVYLTVYNSLGSTVSTTLLVTETPAAPVNKIGIIYNDALSADITLAWKLKRLALINPLGASPTLTGAFPSVSVTLIPQSSIPTSADPAYLLPTTTLILLPGTSLSSYPGQVQNVASQGHGLLAYGAGALHFLDSLNSNWSLWGLAGQQPAAIGWGPSAVGSSATVTVKVKNYSSGVWNFPLLSTSIPAADGSPVDLSDGLTATNVVGYYDATGIGTDPVGGTLYAADAVSPGYYPAVRQGRFIQFGIDIYPNSEAGQVLLLNLLDKLAAF